MNLKSEVFIFAGTSEGREIAEILAQKGFLCTVSVATEYGASLLSETENLTVLQGRLSSCQMAELFSQKEYLCVIDATHPFATEVSKEIRKACNLTKKRYIRFARETSCSLKSFSSFPDISSAADWLEKQNDVIFVSTGSKELPILSQKISDKSRLFVRVLPLAESLEICAECNIPENQIIAMKGPFSMAENEKHFAQSGAKILLTKESGARGGYFEKIQAAEKLGLKIAVIQNPEREIDLQKCELSFSSIKEMLDELFALSRLPGQAGQ